MDDKQKKPSETVQSDIVTLDDENRQVDNFVSEWGFHSTDDTAEFFPKT